MIVSQNRILISKSKQKYTSHHFTIFNLNIPRLHTTFIHVLLDFFLSFYVFQLEWVLSQRVHISLVTTHFPSSSISLRAWMVCVACSHMTGENTNNLNNLSVIKLKTSPQQNSALQITDKQNPSHQENPLPNQDVGPSTKSLKRL